MATTKVTKDETSKVEAYTSNVGQKQADKDLQVDMTVVGRPSLASGQVIYLDNVGKRFSGYYHIKVCEHVMSPDQGYLCKLTLVRNTEKIGKESGSITGKVTKTTKSKTTTKKIKGTGTKTGKVSPAKPKVSPSSISSIKDQVKRDSYGYPIQGGDSSSSYPSLGYPEIKKESSKGKVKYHHKETERYKHRTKKVTSKAGKRGGKNRIQETKSKTYAHTNNIRNAKSRR